MRAVASGLSHGTEMLVYRGQVPDGLALDLPTLRGGFAFPIKYGYASVGRVEETGPGVERPRVGEVVFVHHPHQSEYVAPAALAVPLPEQLDPQLGVFTANLEMAVNALLDAHPRLRERLVIFGQGVVGLLLTQVARAAGVGLIVAVEPLPRRRALARAVGADLALAPDEQLPGTVYELTGGVGADLALEASGNPAALNQAIECVAFQGTVVVCSWYGTKPAPLALGGVFHRRRLRLVSSQVSTVDPRLAPRWDAARRREVALELLPRLHLEPLVSHRLPVERAAEAYRLVDQQPAEVVQVLLTYAA